MLVFGASKYLYMIFSSFKQFLRHPIDSISI